MVTQKVQNVCRDVDDHIVIECALEAQAHFIITGDKDLLTIKTFKNIHIITPEDFLKILY